jgi:uncharacterized membrane protein YeaQ/YmgE (transglycosylase-associated protein family)
MNMSNESLFVIVIVGVVAGWLAGLVVQGTGFGIIGDLIIGIAGAFIGSWLLPRLHLHFGTSTMLTAIIDATLGAIVLLLAIRLLRGGSRWGRA